MLELCSHIMELILVGSAAAAALCCDYTQVPLCSPSDSTACIVCVIVVTTTIVCSYHCTHKYSLLYIKAPHLLTQSYTTTAAQLTDCCTANSLLL
jgi:hypothetical protein